MTRYSNLFSPLAIGHVTVRNRILQTGHTKLYSANGYDSPRNIAYQVERAKGGIGLIITGNRLVHPTSTTASPRYSWAYLREAIPHDRQLTDAVHEHGAVIVAQLNHFGINAISDSTDDYRVLWGPSAIKSPEYGETAKEMELDDIREVTDWWARSAEYSREGGFDGVEVHLSHTYLLHQFISPLYNKRTDEYGGSFENRLRFALEVIDEVRRRVGRDFIVGTRISLSDFVPGSLEIEDAIEVARVLEATGKLDYINVTAGGYHDGLSRVVAASDTPDGWLVERVAKLKAVVEHLPVFAVGGIKDPAMAEEIIASGKADMVAMTRAQIAEPELANKAREGREDEIYHCIRGNQGCISRDARGLGIVCTVNPATGRERLFGAGTLVPASPPRRWLVAGGGPAGMKAAEILAKRGHQVTLVEREAQLGGQVNLILRTPGRETFRWIVTDIEAQMRKHGVEIVLGEEVTRESVAQHAPDAVIVATGSRPQRTGYSSVAPMAERLPGADLPNVVTIPDVLAESAPIGERILILDDEGTRAVAGTAEVLLGQGKQVEIVTRFTSLFPVTALTLDQGVLYERLFANGLRYRLNSWVRQLDGNAATVYNLFGGEDETLAGFDTFVLATGSVADDALYLALKQQDLELHRIGDCHAPRRLDHAIYEGFVAGRELWSGADRYIVEGSLERRDAELAAI